MVFKLGRFLGFQWTLGWGVGGMAGIEVPQALPLDTAGSSLDTTRPSFT